ncbi:MAG: hypothetical protein IPM92_00945 [Saprospiraceae bacterium]|nr:hypothetical protein [Saprospiraceae bacterium]
MRAFIFILGIIGIPFFQEALSQVQWQRLNNQKTFIPEDVLVSPSGDKFISIYGRKTILHKKSGGDQWVDILANNPELSYFFFNDTKKIFLDFRGTPLLYYNNGSFDGLFANSNDEFDLDTSTLNNIHVRFSNDLHFDTLGNYFQIENNKLIKYNNKLEAPKLIFNKQEPILKIAMFQADVNYVLTQHHEDSLYYYLLNSASAKSQLLAQLELPKKFQSLTAIGRSGNLFIVKADGLYRLDRLSLELNKLILDPALQTAYSVSALYVTKAGQFIVNAENYFYFSDDDGNTWTQLASFAHGFPDLSNIRQIEISDSSNALAIVEDECSNMTLELSEYKRGWYLSETNYSSVHRGSLLVNSKSKIYAQRADCYVEESNGDAFTWKSTQIEGKDLLEIYKHSPDDLFAITAGQKQLFHSFDGGDLWSEITEIHKNFPDLVFLDFKNLATGVSLLLGAYIDPLSGQIERYLPFIKMGASDWIGLDKAQSVFFKLDIKFDKKIN